MQKDFFLFPIVILVKMLQKYGPIVVHLIYFLPIDMPPKKLTALKNSHFFSYTYIFCFLIWIAFGFLKKRRKKDSKIEAFKNTSLERFQAILRFLILQSTMWRKKIWKSQIQCIFMLPYPLMISRLNIFF